MARASIAYVVLYTAVAAYAPYLSLYYQSLGIPFGGIGALAAFTSAVALVCAPTWGMIHDRFPTSRVYIPLAAVIASVGGVGLANAGASPLLVAFAAAFACGMSGMAPMMDVRVLDMAGSDRTRYAHVRMWGSFSFMIAAPIIGILVRAEGYGALFLVFVPMVLLGGLASTMLPGRSTGVRVGGLRRAPGRVLGHRPIALFLIGALVGWTAVSSQVAFFSIYVRQLGGSSEAVGWAWSAAAALEIPSMLFFPQLARRFGTERLIVLGMVILVARQIANAVFTDPSVLIGLSLVQGLGYGLLLIGGIAFVSRQAPRGTAATAQGILNSVTFSMSSIIGSGLGGVVAGWLTIRVLYVISACLGTAAIVLIAMAVLPAAGRLPEGFGPDAPPPIPPPPAPPLPVPPKPPASDASTMGH
ncbi:MAG: MFS transporter [Candidatus Limnocylindrales bacterium]